MTFGKLVALGKIRLCLNGVLGIRNPLILVYGKKGHVDITELFTEKIELPG